MNACLPPLAPSPFLSATARPVRDNVTAICRRVLKGVTPKAGRPEAVLLCVLFPLMSKEEPTQVRALSQQRLYAIKQKKTALAIIFL